MAIERFVLVDEVTAATSFAINQNGQDYRVLPAALKTYLDTLAGTADGPFIQYSAPSATGFSVQINDDDLDVWLVLTPIAGYAAGTLILPTVANATSGQEITINTTQSFNDHRQWSVGDRCSDNSRGECVLYAPL